MVSRRTYEEEIEVLRARIDELEGELNEFPNKEYQRPRRRYARVRSRDSLADMNRGVILGTLEAALAAADTLFGVEEIEEFEDEEEPRYRRLSYSTSDFSERLVDLPAKVASRFADVYARESRQPRSRQYLRERPLRRRASVREEEQPQVYHVVADEKGWVLELEGSDEPVKDYKTKEEAVTEARQLASDHAPSELIIHRGDGSIQERHNYNE